MTATLEQLGLFEHPAESAFYANIAVHRGWAVAAERAMGYLVDRGEPFTADDLRDLMADVTVQPTTKNAIGGLFMAWHRRGLIERVGYQTSRHTQRKYGVNAVWRATTKH